MNGNVIIRPVSLADHNAWLAMLDQYDPAIGAESAYAWQRFFATSSGLHGLIAESNGEPVGLMHYVFHDLSVMRGPICYLADLYVKPEHRRRGIARSMLDHLVELACTQRWRRIYWVTEHDNPARSLYDQYGLPEFVRYHVDFSPEHGRE